MTMGLFVFRYKMKAEMEEIRDLYQEYNEKRNGSPV